MKVDVQTLGTFNRLAHEGAEQAAVSLGTLAGIDTTVEATTIDLATRHDVVSDFRGRDLVGVTIGFSEGLAGEALLVFDRTGARTLAKNLPGGAPESPEDVHRRVEEVGNILVSGFVDGWADYLDATIDITPPELVTGSGGDVVPDDAPVLDESEHVLAFTSLLETTNASVTASIYLFPERDSFETVLEDGLAEESAPIPLDKLRTFNRMTARGAKQASQNVTMMTGTETTVEVSRLSFLPVEQTVSKLSDDPYVGIVVSLDGMPSGYLLILFDESSAAAIAEQMGAGAVDDEFGAMHRSAIEEIGNIICSGFVDGWANVLETKVEHSPPEFVHDYASAIVDPVASRLAANQQYAFVFDSLVRTTDDAVSCEIFALPDEVELKQALENLRIDDETAANDEALATAMEADPDEVF